MSRTSDYEKQLHESCRLVAERLQIPESRWKTVFQSRSGRPQDPWLEPDIIDYLRELHSSGIDSVVISPIGFLSDHMEVLYDLDDEARRFCDAKGIRMARAGTPGNHPQFVTMIRKLIEERICGRAREGIGQFPPNHDFCPIDCCPAPMLQSFHPMRRFCIISPLPNLPFHPRSLLVLPRLWLLVKT